MNEVENKQLVTSFPSHLNMIQSRNTSFPINQRTPLAARHNCESFSRKDVLISTPKSHPRSLTEDGNLRLKKNGNISSSSLTPGSRKVTYKSAGELEYGTDGQLTADKRSSVGEVSAISWPTVDRLTADMCRLVTKYILFPFGTMW